MDTAKLRGERERKKGKRKKWREMGEKER